MSRSKLWLLMGLHFIDETNASWKKSTRLEEIFIVLNDAHIKLSDKEYRGEKKRKLNFSSSFYLRRRNLTVKIRFLKKEQNIFKDEFVLIIVHCRTCDWFINHISYSPLDCFQPPVNPVGVSNPTREYDINYDTGWSSVPSQRCCRGPVLAVGKSL